MNPWILALFTMIASLASAQTPTSIYDLSIKDLSGKEASFVPYKGKVLLLVNVASKCGLTKQYKALELLQEKYKERGFSVLGFPCNDFMGQEPGTPEQIQQFCSTTYGVTFPLFEKLHVKGAEQHPLYAFLTGKGAAFPGNIAWNFGKFLVGRDGKILARFEPKTTPDSPEVVKAVEAALATAE
jgi:glutathione peroxidase